VTAGPRDGVRLRLVVLFGGTSAEHEVSRASAASVVRSLDPRRYDVVAVGIGRDGVWRRLSARVVEAARRPPTATRAIDDQLPVSGAVVGPYALAGADVVFPVLHGPGGEDGSLQGLLETVGLPYVGAGVLGSAVGMDKVATKRALAADGLPVLPSVWLDEDRWASCGDPVGLLSGLRRPWFVKPANLGSSIGITRVTRPEALAGAVETALAHDGVVLVEEGMVEEGMVEVGVLGEGVVGARELECGVLGGYAPQASAVGEVQVSGGWFDFDQKYFGDSDPMVVPAALPSGVTERVRDLSVRAFASIGGWGLARVDFLYDQRRDRLVVNELNTMPGFTAHSMFPKVWAAAGLDYSQLLDRLVELALDRDRRRRRRRPPVAAPDGLVADRLVSEGLVTATERSSR
jgi:D-alanine-D-alanine ligase